MAVDVLLITNNARLLDHVSSSRFVEGTASDVLIAVRDLVHQGWRLLTHPLYGNFRPLQQPFRSVLLKRPASLSEPVDTKSLTLLEEALSIHASTKTPSVEKPAPSPTVLEDLAFLDMELMKESLLQDHLWLS